MSSQKIVKIVEDICQLGCTRVNEIISELEQGESLDEAGSLSEHETGMVLQELKAIMAVYTKKPRNPK